MNRKSMSAFVQRVCALVAMGVLCATGPAARAQEKPATAGTEKSAATTDVDRLLALPWAESWSERSSSEHSSPPHSPAPIPAVTVSGAAGEEANSYEVGQACV
jgi:hypothetical protein